ncbi:MAG: FkbM family methyltransferase [Planctomycetota bacterium]
MPTTATTTGSWSFSLTGGYRKIRAGLREQRHRRKAQRWTAEDQARLVFYENFVSPESLVFDVGANQGNRTKVFLRPGARVIAVEPQPACVEFLKAVFKDHPRLTIEPTAIGSAPGEAEMLLSQHSTIATLADDWVESVSSSGRFDRSLWGGRITVPIVTLDTLIARHGRPDFVKVDVEGFELEVLRGLSQPVRALSLEFVPEELDKAIACIDRLCELGPYRFRISLGESMAFADHEAVDRDGIIERLQAVPKEEFGDLYAVYEGDLG